MSRGGLAAPSKLEIGMGEAELLNLSLQAIACTIPAYTRNLLVFIWNV